MNTHPGLRLTAIENADGTWNVLDVPIMPPVPKGARLNDEEIGLDWMRKTVDAARVESDMGHLGSLSIYHHPDVDLGPPSKPPYGGKILATRVGTSQMRDEGTVPCLFCDFLFVPPDVLDQIEAGRLSYRSPEVLNWSKFRVDNVSLLSTEPPFFRLPMLGIGERIPFAGEDQQTFATEEAFATARFSDGAPPIYRFSEEMNMPKDEKLTAKMGDDTPEKDEEDVAKMEDGEDGGGPDAASVVKAIESGDISIGDFDLILAAIAARQGETSEPEAEEEAEMIEEEKNIASAPAAFSDPETAAKVVALEDFKNRIEAKELLDERLKTATAKFAAAGVDPTETVIQQVRDYAATSDEGAFAKFTDFLAEHLERDPAPTFVGAVRRAHADDPPEVAKFAAGDPDKLVQARKFNRMYDDAQARGWGLESTREEYIRFAMGRGS